MAEILPVSFMKTSDKYASHNKLNMQVKCLNVFKLNGKISMLYLLYKIFENFFHEKIVKYNQYY